MRRVHLDHDIKDLAQEIVLVSSQARKVSLESDIHRVLYPEAHVDGTKKDNNGQQHHFKYPSISDSSILAPTATAMSPWYAISSK
jgi:hypothetical protein